MSTDLEQLSKELELVHRREVDPFAKPLPEPDVREVTEEREAPKDGDTFGVCYLLSEEELVRFTGNPESLVIDAYVRMCMDLGKKMARDGFVVDRDSIVFDQQKNFALLGLKLGIKARGIKISAPGNGSELMKNNVQYLGKALEKIVTKR